MLKKLLAVTISILILSTSFTIFAEDVGGSSSNGIDRYRFISFSEYLEKHNNAKFPKEVVDIDISTFTADEGMSANLNDNFIGSNKKAVVCGDIGKITFPFNVEQEGLYSLFIEYYPIDGKGADIERSLYINGTIPFEEARSISFRKLWVDEGEKIFSKSGNEYRRRQVEQKDFISLNVKNTSGYSNEVLKFYFNQGKNTIAFESISEPIAITKLSLVQVQKEDYADVLAEYNKKGYKPVSPNVDIIKIQGEDAKLKSSPTLYGIEDRTSPANDPYSSDNILLNTVGGYNWRYQGQWLEWDFDVAEEGLYKIGFRANQSYKSGAFVTREIKIDGMLPFSEAANVKIPYNTEWQNITLGDDKPNLIYLSKGKHTIRMEVNIGELGQILAKVESSVQELNNLYQKILMVVGAFPDALRDYSLEKNIPNIFDILNKEIANLESCSKQLSSISKKAGEQSATVDQLVFQLKSFVEKSDTIPERMTKLNDMLSSMATWILSSSEQPLVLDYIMVAPPEKEFFKPDVAWYVKFGNEVKEFFLSFFKNYNFIDDLSEEGKVVNGETTLWLAGTAGRDQASVIKMLSDNFFTRERNYKLNLRLVDMGVLLRAVSANAGPDVAIFQGQAQPLNYGVRSALYDLNQFEDVKQVTARFPESAVTPFRLENKLYALPEQQIFPMMFYRKDILDNLKIEPPKTWDELYKIIPVLRKNFMDVALPTPVSVQSGGEATALNSVYVMMLLQNGQNIYNAQNSRCILNENKAIDIFKTWTELYTKYKMPKNVNELNYFRTGQAPIVITGYTFYNNLVVAAPEIKGLWDMTLVPGTKKSDGTIDHSAASGLSAVIMFDNAKDKKASWEFMKWWTDTETQVLYGREMETLQGTSARWPTANSAALALLPWSTKNYNLLSSQKSALKGVPEVPGGYYVGRNIDNAAKGVINEGSNPRETLLDFVDDINQEIIIKRKEFRME